jgi:hypothetical protein
MKDYRALWVALVILALASPIGLYLPEALSAGAAWGEWGLDEIAQMLGYVPSGMEKLAALWQAPIPDYGLPGQEDAPLSHRGLAYIVSALVGIGLCGGVAYVLSRCLMKRDA